MFIFQIFLWVQQTAQFTLLVLEHTLCSLILSEKIQRILCYSQTLQFVFAVEQVPILLGEQRQHGIRSLSDTSQFYTWPTFGDWPFDFGWSALSTSIGHMPPYISVSKYVDSTVIKYTTMMQTWYLYISNLISTILNSGHFKTSPHFEVELHFYFKIKF